MLIRHGRTYPVARGPGFSTTLNAARAALPVGQLVQNVTEYAELVRMFSRLGSSDWATGGSMMTPVVSLTAMSDRIERRGLSVVRAGLTGGYLCRYQEQVRPGQAKPR